MTRQGLLKQIQRRNEPLKRIEELEKEKCELLGIIQGKDKAIADLKKENARMRELLKTLSESIVMTADDTFWSLKEDVEKFLEEKK